MKIRLYDNDGSDFADYEADTIEEIREQVKNRITLSTWKNGHSEMLEE